ncbi:MAG: glutathione S-transferase [Litorimonas sp.]
MPSIKLYDNPLSGHAHRPRALLKLLNVEYETVFVDFAKGDHKQPNFLKINPLGQVPAFVDEDVALRDSTSILMYLALTYDPTQQWFPIEPALAAQVQEWLAISTKEIYTGPCAARLVKLFGASFDYDDALKKTEQLFTTLFEPHLTGHDWLVGDKPSIADIANYGYVAAAHEGGIDLNTYPNIEAWVKRLEALEGFEAIPKAANVLGKAA